jgi:hypothetical protein
MPRTRTFLQLQDEVYERADVRESHIERPEMRRLVNGGLARLYRILVRASPDWVESSTDLAVVSGTAVYAMPADFWMIRNVAFNDNGRWIPMRRFMSSERYQFQTGSQKWDVRYRIRDSGIRVGGTAQLELRPEPNWSDTVRVAYIPAPPSLDLTGADDAVTLDGVAGWEEFVILDAVIKLKEKQEEDATSEIGDLVRLKADIAEDASDRDEGEPKRVRDVENELSDVDFWFRGQI